MRRLALVFLVAAIAHAATLRYWIEPCAARAACRQGDPQLAEWAIAAWQTASGGKLALVKAASREHAQIRVYWAGERGGLYGEARPIVVDGAKGAEVFVVTPAADSADPLLRDTVVYLTCLHETGHALGLPHTAAFDDIMYNFQYGGDVPEYFGRYRRKLHARRDIRKHSGMSDADREKLAELYR